MTDEAIQIFLRIRPTGLPQTVDYTIDEGGYFKGAKHTGHASTIKFLASEEFIEKHSYIPSYRFAFDHVFDQPAEQKDVYLEVARPVVERALEGYNGTVFAYGQTATGKTYTILGPPGEDFEAGIEQARLVREREAQKRDLQAIEENDEEDEEEIEESNPKLPSTKSPEKSLFEESDEYVGPESGIILRTLSDVFTYLSRQDGQKTVEISYLEIYNNEGYDLLSGKQGTRGPRSLKDLTRVIAMTDARSKLHIKNLSRHEIRSIEHGMELLARGNAARKVAETQLNEASSRSHCVFTLYVTTKNPAKTGILRSKINLVDLAGSERVSKWGSVNKVLLKETRNINLSLHHLQRVIEALSNKQLSRNRKNKHVPFRSSLITLVLSDSLGGNSLTRMIATVSNENENLDETISTCRFAQRVASINNKIFANQTNDADLMISRLKQEIEELKRNLQSSEAANNHDLQQQTSTEDYDEETLEKMVMEYLQEMDESVILDVEAQNEAVQYCYRRLKKQVLLERQTVTKKTKSKTCVIL